MCHSVVAAPVLKAPLTICNPHEPVSISCDNSGSEMFPSSVNYSNSWQLVCGPSIESCTKPAEFSAVTEIFKLCRSSLAVVWPKNLEFKVSNANFIPLVIPEANVHLHVLQLLNFVQ